MEPLYKETPIDFSSLGRRSSLKTRPEPVNSDIPKRIHEMRSLYQYGRESAEAKAYNFYRQGKFMEDYEDDFDCEIDIPEIFPTYHKLSINQLRSYFSWRSKVRRGIFRPINPSIAYIYIYELLNGIGASSGLDTLKKLRKFEEGFLGEGYGSREMRTNIHRWMVEFCVLKDIPIEECEEFLVSDAAVFSRRLHVLQNAGYHEDREVFYCLYGAAGMDPEKAWIFKNHGEKAVRLLSSAWRIAAGRTFADCIGSRRRLNWYPFSDVIYYKREKERDREYRINDCLKYICACGRWKEESYDFLSFDRDRLRGFIRETDVVLRRYLKAGRSLEERDSEKWAAAYINEAIEREREAGRPGVNIDFSSLDRIRRDADITRDSLLIDEDEGMDSHGAVAGSTVEDGIGAGVQAAVQAGDEAAAQAGAKAEDEAAAQAGSKAGDEAAARAGAKAADEAASRNESLEMQLLRSLLHGTDPAEIVEREGITLSIAADSINEAFYEEIGDNVVFCEQDSLMIVEDYREDIVRMIDGE